MFNLRLCNGATIRYSLFEFGHIHFCIKNNAYFSPHCCKCNSFVCIAAIRCGNACHGPNSDSVYSGSEHRQFNSPRLVKHGAGFPWRVLIGSYQIWRVNNSPYYRELLTISYHATNCHLCKVSWLLSVKPTFLHLKCYLVSVQVILVLRSFDLGQTYLDFNKVWK